MNKHITILAIIISTILLIGSNYYLSGINPTPQNSNLCNFQQSPCSTIIEDLQITLSAGTEVIKAESEINFELLVKSEKPVIITSAWLEGKDMFMGKIPLFFTPNKITQTNTLVSAQTMIGACTEESMVWVMNVALEVEGEARLIQFYFESER